MSIHMGEQLLLLSSREGKVRLHKCGGPRVKTSNDIVITIYGAGGYLHIRGITL